MNGYGERARNPCVSLLDYGAGNVRSVRNAIRLLGYDIIDIEKSEDIDAADVIVFPGVGAFGSAIATLDAKGFTASLRRYLEANRPFFGICIGMQTLFEGSDESPEHRGLGIIPGTVREIDRTAVVVPHIGWNSLIPRKHSSVMGAIAPGDMVYFVHSYRALPTDENREWVLGTTTYGEPSAPEFISAVQRGNVAACQFHPEKSGGVGLRLMAAFLSEVTRGNGAGNGGGAAGAAGAAEGEAPLLPVAAGASTALGKRVVACLDVRTNDEGDLVVTKGDQYDVRERDGEVEVNNGAAGAVGAGAGGKSRVRNLGKPVELAARYYREGADEVCFLNITSFRQGVVDDMPMLEVLERASERVFVPLTVGGGIRGYTDATGAAHTALDVAARYFRAGADKVSLGSDAVYAAEEFMANGGRPTGGSSIEQISRVYGRQAVVVSVDPRRVYIASPADAPPGCTALPLPRHPGPNGEGFAWYQVTVKGGREGRPMDAIALAKACEALGAGEVLLNCVDADGQKSGFDLVLVSAVMAAVRIPVIASSGAGCPEHFSEVFRETGVQAALAAGIFHRREVSIAEVKAHLEKESILVRRG